MYGWLRRADDESTHVVTANRRLARLLTDEFSAIQVEAGRLAWRAPSILSLASWMMRLRASDDSLDQATRINSQQSRLLWESILRDHVRNPLVNINSLARDAREAWERLCDWRVPLEELAAAAHGADQHVFANAASEYAATLEERGWIDDALLTSRVTDAIDSGDVDLPKTILLAGFDRITPAFESLLESARRRGSSVEIETPRVRHALELMAFETGDAELRAAGAWARAELIADPALRVAIVVPQLERDATGAGRLIREGFVPGWQYAQNSGSDAVNVSFGRRLADYPAIDTALMMLAWTFRPLDGREISMLLRTPFLGLTPAPGRARMELSLREYPDRRWTIGQFLGASGGSDDSTDSKDWLNRLSLVAEKLREQPRSAAPAYWAELANAVLVQMNWPGRDVLDSADFQLVDRWRDLLNELARLALITSETSMTEAYSQLGAMASDAVFQPEATRGVLQVIGPLEAAGAQFDRLWISGLTAAQWPPPSRPTALISRRLQNQYRMPDADPRDTTDYAQRVLERLLGSAEQCSCSYSQSAGDSELSPTAILKDTRVVPATTDPGWHVEQLVGRASVCIVAEDPVPPVGRDEKVRGGAGTLQTQLVEPFAAFAYGRLGIRQLDSIAPGLSPLVRGNLVHTALFRLYGSLPGRDDIRSWDSEQLERRIADAVGAAIPRYERRADRVMQALLALERVRIERLLQDVVELDRQRDAFRIDAVEIAREYRKDNLSLELRIDRIDRHDDGSIAVLDYKTGTPRRFLKADGEPRDFQVVVYADALDDHVTALGLINIDSRQTNMDVCTADDMEAWQETLQRWFGEVDRAAQELAAGDVRIHSQSGIGDVRPLGLLSRFGELRRDA